MRVRVRGRERLPLAIAFTLLAACAPGSSGSEVQPPLSLSLSLRPKSSCDLTPVQYTTECLAALEVVVTPQSGEPQRTCVRLDEGQRFGTLADLLTTDEPTVRFATVTGRGPVVFQVRGIHDVRLGDADPCAASSQHWLFWGESLPVDLNAQRVGDAIDVVIGLDCRDCAGGCSGLDTPQCPRLMPPSYCVPFAAGYSCERRCDDDEECFEGAIACDLSSGRCDPEGGEPETGDTGGFCYPCRDSGDCDVGFSCVGAPNASEGLCARDCPLNRCPSGASCRRLGPNLVVFSGNGTSTIDDGP